MKHADTYEKIDPLMRIQEEIKEVMRREEEYKQLVSLATSYERQDIEGQLGHNNLTIDSSLLNITQDENAACFTLYNNKTVDELHSDDSGISAASSPVYGAVVNVKSVNNSNAIKIQLRESGKELRYIGPNCYNLTPDPPKQKLMIRTISSPHLYVGPTRKLNIISAQKGLMERFIATRGKLQLVAKSKKESDSTFATASSGIVSFSTNITPTDNMSATTHNFHTNFDWEPAVIERDQDGRPVRPGYVPVELKIQRELQDLKTRECELKTQRKIRQSTPDLLHKFKDENIDFDDDVVSNEHCYGPNKLRSTKSISELCESVHYIDNIFAKNIKSSDFKIDFCATQNEIMRPAISLAQLCDLDPDDTPSSHQLIAQWESLIQQNA